MTKKKEKKVNVSGKTKHSLDANRKNESSAASCSAATGRRLKMYKTKPKLDSKGKVLKNDFQSHDLPHTRIQPDRRMFGDTRVVNQNELELFGEELQSQMSNNYDFILKERKFPLSLSNDHQKVMDSEDELILIVVALAGALIAQYVLEDLGMPREPCWNSTHTGHKYITGLLRGNRAKCISILRMEKNVFFDLCHELSTKYGLKPSQDISIQEMVAMFLYSIGQGVGKRNVCDRFQRSSETVSRQFHNVLRSLLKMSANIIKPRDPEFRECPKKIMEDERYWPFFKDCIGVIDGTHIPAIIPPDERVAFIGRKGVTTQNVMAVCDFDMLFTFVCAGWEGSAHDSRILHEVKDNALSCFPHPPIGKYYLVDAGYPNQRGYLAPYNRHRYHLEAFRNGPDISGLQEAFNHAHSSLHSVIKRCFGVLKKKWLILLRMPSYRFCTQVRIVVACMALHNFIRLHVLDDDDFQAFGDENVIMPNNEAGTSDDGMNAGAPPHMQEDIEMTSLRDFIAAEIFGVY